ncbi:MAG: hypothetical protein ACLU9S_02550 [Oscillospiraceae bacterium]
MTFIANPLLTHHTAPWQTPFRLVRGRTFTLWRPSLWGGKSGFNWAGKQEPDLALLSCGLGACPETAARCRRSGPEAADVALLGSGSDRAGFCPGRISTG